MLQSIRDRATGWIAWVIVIFISIPFALWGVQEYAGVGGPVVAANVNGTDIPLRSLQEGVQKERSQLQRALGEAASQFIDDETLRARVLQRMIDDELRRQGAYTAGFRAGDAQVVAQIGGMEAFIRDGKFDRQQYERLLRHNGYTSKQFEELLRNDLVTNQLVQGVVATAFATPAESAAYLRLREQSRDFRYAVISPIAAEQVAVSEEEVAKEYEANRSLFMEPEQLKVAYLELTLDAVAAAVEVDETELERFYQEQKDDYRREEQRRASHILLPLEEGADQAADDKVRADAMSLYERIREGEDFAALAKGHSKDPGSAESGGDLGFFGRGVMVGPFEEEVFSMKAGELSEPVRTDFGYHVIRLEEVRAGESKTFAEVRDEVERNYRRREAEEPFLDRMERLANLTFENPTTLNVAAEELDLTVQTSDWFSRDEGPGVAAERKVRAAAFEEDVLERGNNSTPVELAERHLVLRLVDRKPAAAKPLAEVREAIVGQLRARAARKAATDAGEAMLNALREGGDLAALAETRGAELMTVAAARRDAGEAPKSVMGAVFRLPRPADGAVVAEGVALNDGGYAVVQLTGVADGDSGALSAAERRSEAQALARGAGEVELDDLMAGLRARADIEIKKVKEDEAR